MKLSEKQLGHLIMCFVILIFGLNMPISKHVMSQGLLSSFALTAARMLFAAIAFWITSLFVPSEKVERKDQLTLFFAALTGIVLNQASFIYGLSNTSPVDASIITTVSPLFAMLIAAIALKEPITLKKIGGVLIGGSGAIFLVYSAHNGLNLSGGSLKGNLGVLSGAFFYALYLSTTRKLSAKYSPVTLMKWMFLYATIIFLPFSFSDLVQSPIFYQSEMIPYLLFFFVLFGATYITYMLMPLVQKRMRPTTMTMYNNVQPLIASFVAVMIGQDRFSVEKLIAGLLILSGVYLVTQSKSKAELDNEEVARAKNK